MRLTQDDIERAYEADNHINSRWAGYTKFARRIERAVLEKVAAHVKGCMEHSQRGCVDGLYEEIRAAAQEGEDVD